jgi:hypothetical protein
MKKYIGKLFFAIWCYISAVEVFAVPSRYIEGATLARRAITQLVRGQAGAVHSQPESLLIDGKNWSE